MPNLHATRWLKHDPVFFEYAYFLLRVRCTEILKLLVSLKELLKLSPCKKCTLKNVLMLRITVNYLIIIVQELETGYNLFLSCLCPKQKAFLYLFYSSLFNGFSR